MLHEDPLLRIFDVQVLTRMSKPGLSMLVPPGPFAPRISYGLRLISYGNGSCMLADCRITGDWAILILV